MSDIIELDYEKLFAEMECADSVQVLTGAGISTLSGIPDFRGQNGLYSKCTRHAKEACIYFFK